MFAGLVDEFVQVGLPFLNTVAQTTNCRVFRLWVGFIFVVKILEEIGGVAVHVGDTHFDDRLQNVVYNLII